RGVEKGGSFLNLEGRGEPHRAGREALQERRDPDAGDDPRQRRPRAHVGPVTERQVLVGVGPVDPELVAFLEELLVAVGRPGADDYPLAGLDGAAGDGCFTDASAGDEEEGRG